MDKLGKASERVSDATNPGDSAEAWFLLHQAAHEFAETLNRVSGTGKDFNKCSNVALEAGAMGIPISISGYGGGWTAGNGGYLEAKELLKEFEDWAKMK